MKLLQIYRAFHRFGQATFPDGGSILGSSQFSLLPQLPQKMMFGLKGVKIDSKKSNSCCNLNRWHTLKIFLNEESLRFFNVLSGFIKQQNYYKWNCARSFVPLALFLHAILAEESKVSTELWNTKSQIFISQASWKRMKYQGKLLQM